MSDDAHDLPDPPRTVQITGPDPLSSEEIAALLDRYDAAMGELAAVFYKLAPAVVPGAVESPWTFAMARCMDEPLNRLGYLREMLEVGLRGLLLEDQLEALKNLERAKGQ